MKKLLFITASVVLLASEATAQVRPQDCRPVFPFADAVPPQLDVVTTQAPPPMVARRKFAGGLLLLPLAFAAGLIILTHDHDHHHDTVSPA